MRAHDARRGHRPRRTGFAWTMPASGSAAPLGVPPKLNEVLPPDACVGVEPTKKDAKTRRAGLPPGKPALLSHRAIDDGLQSGLPRERLELAEARGRAELVHPWVRRIRSPRRGLVPRNDG